LHFDVETQEAEKEVVRAVLVADKCLVLVHHKGLSACYKEGSMLAYRKDLNHIPVMVFAVERYMARRQLAGLLVESYTTAD